MARTFLVTGGTGFVGSALVRRLLRAGHRVRVLDNNARGHVRRLQGVLDDVDYVEADIRDPDRVSTAVAGCDAVCHLAYINGTRHFYEQPDLVLDVAVKGMLNIIDACMRHGVGELITASSSEVYQTPPVIPTAEDAPLSVPDPMNPRYSYGGGKIIAELMTINYGRRHFERAIVFRPHNVYGPDMGTEHVLPSFALRMHRLARQQRTGTIRFPIQGDGSETRAFIDVRDFTDGLMTIIDAGEHLNIYHIGTREEVTIADTAHMVASYFERDIDLQPGTLAAGGTVRRCPDTSKLDALGFSPRISIRDGVARLARWYDEHAETLADRETLAEL